MNEDQSELELLSTYDIFIQYLSKILKLFSIHSLLTLVGSKSLLVRCEFTKLLKALFSRDKIINSVLYSAISLVYKCSIILYYKLKDRLNPFIGIQAFKVISAFASVIALSLFVTTGSGFKDIVITITMKALVSIIQVQILKPLNLLQQDSKIFDFISMAFAASLYNIMRLTNPGHPVLDKMLVNHSQYIGNEGIENQYLISKSKVI